MTWREAVKAIKAVRPADGDLIAEAVSRRWRGARFYMPIRVELDGNSAPVGAAARFTRDLLDEVLARGGTVDQVRLILLPMRGHKLDIS